MKTIYFDKESFTLFGNYLENPAELFGSNYSNLFKFCLDNELEISNEFNEIKKESLLVKLLKSKNTESIENITLQKTNTLHDIKTIYFTKLTENKGMYNLDISSEESFSFLFKEWCIILKKNRNLSEWENLLKDTESFCRISNSLIINDCYICNKESREKSLIPLLKFLLPQNLDIPYHIAIFSDAEYNEALYENIVQDLKSIRPKMEFFFSFFFKGGEHDREIISNNFVMTFGTGIDKNSVKNNSSCRISFAENYFTERLNLYRKTYKNPTYKSFKKESHRLLE